MKTNTPLCCPCESAHFRCVWTYDAPPPGEIRFQFTSTEVYRREIFCCGLCGHFVSIHEMDAGALYSGDYVNSNYSDGGIRRAFDRIIALDPATSDNTGRVARLLNFAAEHLDKDVLDERPPAILDVGSGLCVFLHRMKQAGWDCTALDPDERAAAHARDEVGISALCGDFMKIGAIGEFDVVTFNKVLEHVPDPVAMLAKSAKHLRKNGFVYVEVPDGEAAAAEGPAREEFFVDHLHVFSPPSLALLGTRAGFSVAQIERLREPSNKFTLRAFFLPRRVTIPDGDQVKTA